VIRTRRFCDPAQPDDGFRLLVTRFRPRGVKKEDETWDAWDPALGPSKELHAAVYGKTGAPISWDEYQRRYLEEMTGQEYRLQALANRHAAGETITLLCSSHCTDESQCHRSLLKELIVARASAARR
jgi:uncharacterized protein YeaO (DUF488 family)